MEGISVSAIARAIAEYGILGLGWILFIFAMLYIRVERGRYQDLVIHIITYFTKIHMLKGPDDDLTIFADNLFKTQGRDRRTLRSNRQRIDSESDD